MIADPQSLIDRILSGESPSGVVLKIEEDAHLPQRRSAPDRRKGKKRKKRPDAPKDRRKVRVGKEWARTPEGKAYYRKLARLNARSRT